jgi:hypothetical protein
MSRGDNATLESPFDEGILNMTALNRPDCLLFYLYMGKRAVLKGIS